MKKSAHFNQYNELDQLLHRLGLSTFRDRYQALAEGHEKMGKSCLAFLHDLCSQESEHRDAIKKERLLKTAKLPRHKIITDFEISRIPSLSKAFIERLATGEFMDQAVNLLVFGVPGTGKTHLCIALAREWCLMGRKVLFKSASQLIEDLRQAQANHALHTYIKQLDKFECLILDDISYIPLEKADTSVLFQLINERYERRSMVITSNLSFSSWENIFPDKITAVAAIDRLVHHSEILELNAPSYRIAKSQKASKAGLVKTL